MMKRIDQLPTVLTSFAYRTEYFSELEGMIATVREHHPNWQLVTGKGPIPGLDKPTLEIESPSGKRYWSLPIPLDLDGSERDWDRIVMMKGWWVSQVWHNFRHLVSSCLDRRRIVWLDADGRLNGPLDIELDPAAEIVASPWWTDRGTPEHEHHVCSGLLVFQGSDRAIVEGIINRWSDACMRSVALGPSPSAFLPGPEGDQCLLTKVLNSYQALAEDLLLIKLPYDKYCGVPSTDGTPKSGALVDQWMMNTKMRLPKDRDRNWPPPESRRRRGRS